MRKKIFCVVMMMAMLIGGYTNINNINAKARFMYLRKLTNIYSGAIQYSAVFYSTDRTPYDVDVISYYHKDKNAPKQVIDYRHEKIYCSGYSSVESKVIYPRVDGLYGCNAKCYNTK